jgi:hypothetical protein
VVWRKSIFYLLYHTKWEAHVRKIRGVVAERPSPSRGVGIFS